MSGLDNKKIIEVPPFHLEEGEQFLFEFQEELRTMHDQLLLPLEETDDVTKTIAELESMYTKPSAVEYEEQRLVIEDPKDIPNHVMEKLVQQFHESRELVPLMCFSLLEREDISNPNNRELFKHLPLLLEEDLLPTEGNRYMEKAKQEITERTKEFLEKEGIRIPYENLYQWIGGTLEENYRRVNEHLEVFAFAEAGEKGGNTYRSYLPMKQRNANTITEKEHYEDIVHLHKIAGKLFLERYDVLAEEEGLPERKHLPKEFADLLVEGVKEEREGKEYTKRIVTRSDMLHYLTDTCHVEDAEAEIIEDLYDEVKYEVYIEYLRMLFPEFRSMAPKTVREVLASTVAKSSKTFKDDAAIAIKHMKRFKKELAQIKTEQGTEGKKSVLDVIAAIPDEVKRLSAFDAKMVLACGDYEPINKFENGYDHTLRNIVHIHVVRNDYVLGVEANHEYRKNMIDGGSRGREIPIVKDGEKRFRAEGSSRLYTDEEVYEAPEGKGFYREKYHTIPQKESVDEHDSTKEKKQVAQIDAEQIKVREVPTRYYLYEEQGIKKLLTQEEWEKLPEGIELYEPVIEHKLRQIGNVLYYLVDGNAKTSESIAAKIQSARGYTAVGEINDMVREAKMVAWNSWEIMLNPEILDTLVDAVMEDAKRAGCTKYMRSVPEGHRFEKGEFTVEVGRLTGEGHDNPHTGANYIVIKVEGTNRRGQRVERVWEPMDSYIWSQNDQSTQYHGSYKSWQTPERLRKDMSTSVPAFSKVHTFATVVKQGLQEVKEKDNKKIYEHTTEQIKKAEITAESPNEKTKLGQLAILREIPMIQKKVEGLLDDPTHGTAYKEMNELLNRGKKEIAKDNQRRIQSEKRK